MRYVEGTDLRALLEARGTLDPARGPVSSRRSRRPSGAAHRRDLIHRDVSPPTCSSTREDGREHVYLTDFGTARHVASIAGLTRPGSIVGSSTTWPPSGSRGRRGDAPADVYALGCVLYETLTGGIPYPRDPDAAKIYAHLNAPVPDAREMNDRVPDALAVLAMQAMAKEPEARVHSASELAERLVEAADTGRSPFRQPCRRPRRSQSHRQRRRRSRRPRAPHRADGHPPPPTAPAPAECRLPTQPPALQRRALKGGPTGGGCAGG